MVKQISTVQIEDARLIFKNFAGREGQYNRKGDRNFGVILPPDVADQMHEDGWNVKYLTSRDEDNPETTPWLPVAVSFDVKPPKVTLITSAGRTHLDEEAVEILDWLEAKEIDLILNPHPWDVNGKSGIKAYLKTLYITQEEDDLDRKYANVGTSDTPPPTPLQRTDSPDETES